MRMGDRKFSRARQRHRQYQLVGEIFPHRRRACQVAFHLFHQLCRDHFGTDALFTDDKKAFGDIFTFDFKRDGITRPWSRGRL